MTDDVAARPTSSDSPHAIPPDTKDWTWVVQRPCPACGFDGPALPAEGIAPALREAAERWSNVLATTGMTDRPSPDVWSPLEYLCHVRDVCGVFAERARLMLTEDDPQFADWDQDEAATQGRYGEQDPALAADQLADAVEAAARVFAGVTGEQWQRPGRRSNGSAFTVETLGRYFVHDVVHHLHDVHA
jgi:hypothetical protein